MNARGKLIFAMCAIGVAAQAQPGTLRTYQDPQQRFQFTYPADFGAPSPGTDNGFRDRTAAIRFSESSAGVHAGRIILGGEAVLTSGAPRLDLQAAGGLYDALTLQLWCNLVYCGGHGCDPCKSGSHQTEHFAPCRDG